MREASSVAELWVARSLPRRSPSSVFVRKGIFVFLREHLGNRQEQQQINCISDTRNQITAHHRKISTKSINCFKTYKFVWLKEKRGNSTKLRNLFSHWKYDFLVSGFFVPPTVIVDGNCFHKLRRLVLLFSQLFYEKCVFGFITKLRYCFCQQDWSVEEPLLRNDQVALLPKLIYPN